MLCHHRIAVADEQTPAVQPCCICCRSTWSHIGCCPGPRVLTYEDLLVYNKCMMYLWWGQQGWHLAYPGPEIPKRASLFLLCTPLASRPVMHVDMHRLQVALYLVLSCLSPATGNLAMW